MLKVKNVAFLMFVFTFLWSCKKDNEIKVDPPTPVNAPSVVFNFNALAANQPLIANTKWYTNANGDSFTVTKFNYYISNVKLKRNDGVLFEEAESYHVIKNVEGVNSFTIANLPEGSYDQVEFLIGVDSLHNVSGAQTGDLSPDSVMFWGWNFGYIFFKLEGEFKTVNAPVASTYQMHIGGYSGQYNCIQKCTFILDHSLVAAKNKRSKIVYNANIDEIFMHPNIIDYDTYSVTDQGRKAKVMSDNYKDMFVVDRVEN